MLKTRTSFFPSIKPQLYFLDHFVDIGGLWEVSICDLFQIIFKLSPPPLLQSVMTYYWHTFFLLQTSTKSSCLITPVSFSPSYSLTAELTQLYSIPWLVEWSSAHCFWEGNKIQDIPGELSQAWALVLGSISHISNDISWRMPPYPTCLFLQHLPYDTPSCV